jgi:hypothetical protein
VVGVDDDDPGDDGDREVVHLDQARSNRRRLSLCGATHKSAVGLCHGLSPVIWMLGLQHA